MLLWRMRNLILEGKIVVFKSLVLSKIVLHFRMSKVPNELVGELQNTQISLLLETSNA